MTSAVIYYSYEGNTRYVAKIIAKRLKASLIELKPKKELLKTHGFMKYFWGGKQVVMKERPILEPIKSLSKFDTIYLGTPVWAWTYTPPIRSLLANNSIKHKKVHLFCTYDNNPGSTLNDMRSSLKENKVISEAGFQKPLLNKELVKKEVLSWLKT